MIANLRVWATRFSTMLFACLAGSAAGAQTAPVVPSAPDVGQMQRQIDDLKRQLEQMQTRSPAAPAAPVATTRPDPQGCIRSPEDNKRYCPGWVVQVMNGQSTAPAGRFVPPDSSNISITEHNQFFPVTGYRLIYDGEGYLNATGSGQYSFLMNGTSKRDNSCNYQFSINDRTVIETTGRSMSAGASLSPGLYRVTFHFLCQKQNFTSIPVVIPSMQLLILPPGENYPRPFRPGELLHFQPG